MTEPRYNKLLQVLRDWGYENQEPGATPRFVDSLQPVIIVDDASEYIARTWPGYLDLGSQAAVAAVYSLVGLQAQTQPLLVEIAEVMSHGSNSVVLIKGVTDLRTANQATSATSTGWNRGQAAQDALVLTGTTTVAPAGFRAWAQVDALRTGYLSTGGVSGVLLRPFEFLWMGSTVVNVALGINFVWSECQYQLIDPIDQS